MASALARPFRATGRAVRRAPWPAKVLLTLVVLVAVPIAFVVTVYLLPPGTAVSLGTPVLAWVSDSPPLPGDLDPVSERSVLLAADGTELATLFDKNRVRITRDDIPDVFVAALLSSEDDGFYEHPGINHRAVMRAALANLRSGDIEQGGSTLTQQLVKNVYLDPGRTVRRKLTEAWYALQLEDRLSKDEILERYLNETYFGQGAYGLGAAAELYFDTPAEQLDVAQSALLVGLIPAPSRLNPIDNPEGARQARDRVLDRMQATGRLDAGEVDRARERQLGLRFTPPPPPAEPFFVAYVRDRLLGDERFAAAFGDDEQRRERLVFGGGLTVHTTLDLRLQQQATAAIADTMGRPDNSPLATIVTVEPATGAIRAMAVGPKEFGPCPRGERECPRTMVNPAVAGLGGSGRQPGSAFKPFVLTAALSEGLPTGWEERTAAGKPIEGCDDGGEPYVPENYSEDPGVKDMYSALRVSNNVYHAKLGGRLGPPALIESARAAGLGADDLPEQCSLALGSGSVFPLAMAEGYATFANGGEHCAPLVVTRIEFGAIVGDDPVDFEPECESRFEPELAHQITDLLREPVAAGTGTAAQLDRPVAGKTGTTDDYRDAWFVGFVPQLSTAVWLGFERPRPMENVLGETRVTGGSIPARMWAAYMRGAVEDLPVEDFPAPPPPERLEVPDFRDSDADDLLDEYAEDYTLHLETREVRNYRDPGTVARQSPKPGTVVDAGTLVTLRVSNGLGRPPRVPDVVGLPEDEARRVLEEEDYVVVVEEQSRPLAEGTEPEEPDRTVIAMSPDAGTPLEPEEEVTITVVVYEVVPAEDEPSEEPDDGSASPTPRPSPRPTGGAEEPEPDDPDEPSAFRGQVKFGSIVADPRGSDVESNGGEYVTLVTGRNPVDVSGWTIQYEGGGTLSIGAGYVVERASSIDVHTGPGTNRPPRRYFNGLGRQVLRNSGGVLILRDDEGREVTRRSY